VGLLNFFADHEDMVTNVKLSGGQEFQVHLYDTMGVVLSFSGAFR